MPQLLVNCCAFFTAKTFSSCQISHIHTWNLAWSTLLCYRRRIECWKIQNNKTLSLTRGEIQSWNGKNFSDDFDACGRCCCGLVLAFGKSWREHTIQRSVCAEQRGHARGLKSRVLMTICSKIVRTCFFIADCWRLLCGGEMKNCANDSQKLTLTNYINEQFKRSQQPSLHVAYDAETHISQGFDLTVKISNEFRQ